MIYYIGPTGWELKLPKQRTELLVGKYYKDRLDWGWEDWKQVYELLPKLIKEKHSVAHASRVGNYNAVSILLEAEYDPSLLDNAAIIEASINGHALIVKLLLKNSKVDP